MQKKQDIPQRGCAGSLELEGNWVILMLKKNRFRHNYCDFGFRPCNDSGTSEKMTKLSEMLCIYKGVRYQKFLTDRWNVIKLFEFQNSIPSLIDKETGHHNLLSFSLRYLGIQIDFLWQVTGKKWGE
jgi:hypothetical protein